MNATELPNDSVFDAVRRDDASNRVRFWEFCLVSVLSLFVTVTAIFVCGTHVNTWLGTLSLSVAAR